MKPRSLSAAATDPIAVPQIPRKWKCCGASPWLTRILYTRRNLLRIVGEALVMVSAPPLRHPGRTRGTSPTFLDHTSSVWVFNIALARSLGPSRTGGVCAARDDER